MSFSEQQKALNKNKVRNSIPIPSDKCDFEGCDRDTLLAITLVRNSIGTTCAGVFSDFGNPSKNRLRDGYTFLRFITRCAECYQNDMNRGTAGSLL